MDSYHDKLVSLTAASPLPLLGPHLPTLVISTIACFAIQRLSHIVTPSLLGSKWAGFDKRTRKGWASHTVSTVHALVVIPLAARSLQSRILANDPVFGYDPSVGHVLAMSSGYFIWDTIDSILNSTIGFMVHGVCCLAVYLFSFRPFLAGFGPAFLLWELSTPFLNIHWFMDKTQLSTSYSTVFLVNSLVFMLVFFLARILFGGYQSIAFIQAMWTNRDRIPLHLHIIYCTGNLALNGLNFLWFSKMVGKMVARLQGTDKPKAEEKEALLKNEERKEEGSLALPVAPPSPVLTMRKEEL